MACIYAGYLSPDYRLTAMSLSAVINGVATIFLFLVIDPYIATATDDAAQSNADRSFEPRFRRIIVWMVITRAAGTLLGQPLLIPAAYLIASVAEVI